MKSCRDSTKKNYLGIWRSFNQFFIKLDDKPDSWEDRLTLYVGHLIKNDHKSTTIRSYISAIKSVLRDLDIELNENKFLLNSLTKACKLVNDRVRHRFPIQKGLLNLLLKELEIIFGNQPYLEGLYKAIFSTMYFGLFRIGELVEGNHAVKAKDVHIGKNKNKMMFILRTSKTHGLNCAPQIIKISEKNDNSLPNSFNEEFCPFTLLKSFVDNRPHCQNSDEQFFVFSDNSPIFPVHVRKILKESLRRVGLNAHLYDTHSMRAGRAVDFLKMNLSVETIKKLGRWRSNSVFDYLKI